jgi:hypothetical protein
MAASDKNILISPQRGSTTQVPSIVFTGDGNDPITLRVLDGVPGALSFEGGAGQLFSLTDNLTSGSIFSVNDISGLPSIDVNASGLIQIAPLGGTVAIGKSTVVAGRTVDIKGNTHIDGTLTSTDIRFSIIYDSNDSAYYADFNGTTRLNNLHSNIATFGSRANSSNFGGNTGGLSGVSQVLEVRANGSIPLMTWHYENIATRHIGLDSSGFLQVYNPNEAGGSVLQANSSLRAPIFYDSNDTGYYIDPNSTSNFVRQYLTYNSASGLANGSFNVSSATIGGLHFTNGSGVSGSGNQAAITFMGSSASQAQAGIYVHNNNSEGTHMALCTTDSYATGPQIGLRIMNSGYSLFPRSYVEATGSFRAPIFYDSNNTGYYVDPASQTNLNYLRLANNNSIYFSTTLTAEFNHDSDSTPVAFNMIKSGNSITDSNNYGVLSLVRRNHNNSATSAGAGLYFVLKDDGGTDREYAGIYGKKTVAGASGGELVFMNYGRNEVAYCNSDFFSHTSDIRTPIFYDSNDTGFYLDPASKSRLNTLSLSDDRTLSYPGILNLGSISYNYNFLNGSWSSSITAGIMAHCADQWEIAIHDSGTRVVSPFLFDGGSNHRLLMGRDIGWGTMYIEAANSFRAPIFYDSNDTAYYLDAASSTTSLSIAGAIEQGPNFAHPNIEWSASGTSTGMVIFRLPGGTGNYGMVHMVFDYYEYNSPRTATIIVGGHNWNGAWYNVACNVAGFIDKIVRVGVKDGQYCVVFGEAGSSWSYGTIRLRKIHNGSFYNNIMDLGGVYSASQTTTESFSNISADIRESRTSGAFIASTITASTSASAPIYYDSNNTAYYTDPNGQSSLWGVAIRGDYGSTNTDNQIFFWGAGNTTTSAIGFKANGGSFGNPTGTGDGYNTYFTMDTDGRGWVFRRGVGGTDFNSAYNSGWILNNGVWQANSSMRAPIFYDSNNTGYYTDPASTSILNSLTINGTLNAYSNAIVVNRINFRDTSGSADSDPYCLRWMDESANGGLSWLELQMNDDSNEEFRIYGNSCSGYGCGEISGNLYHRFRADGWAWHSNYVEGGSSVRGPIFYDSNDTGYYVDPASTTQLNVARFASGGYTKTYSFTPAGTKGSGNYVWVRASMGGFNAGGDTVRFTITRSINDNGNDPYGGCTADFTAHSREWHGGQETCTVFYTQHGSAPYGQYITNAGPRDLAGNGYWFYMRVLQGVTYKVYVHAESGPMGNFDPASQTDPGSVPAVYTGFNILGSGGNSADFVAQNNSFGLSSVRAPIFYDYNDTGFYDDPASTSNLNLVQTRDLRALGQIRATGWYNSNSGSHTGPAIEIGVSSPGSSNGYILAYNRDNSSYINMNFNATAFNFGGQSGGFLNCDTSIRSPIFYDSNDTGYYLDPNADRSTNINGFSSRTVEYTKGTYKYNTPRPIHTSDTNYWTGTMGWGTTDFNNVMTWGSGFFDTWSSPSNSPGDTSHWVGVQAYHYVNAANSGYGWQLAGGVTDSLWWRHSWPNNSSWFKVAMYNNNANTSTFYSTLYYDSNDSGYYLDPNSTSDSALRIRGGALHGPNSSWGAYLLVGGDGRQNYTNNTTTASVCTTNGNLHIDAASGFNTYINHYDGNIIYFGNGSNGNWGEWSGSNFIAYGPVYGTIYYDRDNSSYYLNPHNASRLNLLTSDSTISYNGYETGYSGSNSNLPRTNRPYAFGFQESGAWSGTYPDLVLQYHTGVTLAGNASYDGITFKADFSDDTVIFRVNGGSNYLYKYRWMYTTSDGFYSDTNNAHWNPNVSSSYGSWRMIGGRNGWTGIYFENAGNQVNHLMFDTSNNGGFYSQSSARWWLYYNYGNNCWGVGTSTTNSAYNIYCPTGVYSAGRVDGSIFYDSNDTQYYIDGNSESRLYRLRVGPYAGSVQSGGQTGLELVNTGGTGDGNVAAMSFHCSGYYAMHLHLRHDGYFGAGGWSASTWRWYVNMTNGDMTAVGNVTAYSDIRLKEEIEPLQNSLEKLMQINGVSFRWKDLPEVVGHPGKKDFGIIAQEVEKVFPEVVHESAHESPDGDSYKTVAYDKLVPVLLEAIKEQQKQIDDLKKEVERLKSKLGE